jgi:hypothetical protein
MDVSPCVIERLLARGPNQTKAYADGIAGQCSLWVDTVEKVSAKEIDFLNQDCAFGLDRESMLLGDPRKILFRRHRVRTDKT